MIECVITGLTASAEGISRHDDKVIFVPGALVGECVRVEIVRRGARFDRGRLIEIVHPVGRRPTPCRHDHPGGCGGCSLLHATRAAQAEAKRAIVHDALARIGGVSGPAVRETRTPGPELGYRNHARFGVSANGRLTYVVRNDAMDRDPGRAGIEIETCAVLHPRLDELRGALAGRVDGADEVELRLGTRTGERLVILHGAKKCPATLDPTQMDASIVLAQGERFIPVRGLPRFHELVLGARFRISAQSFFQVNTDGAECIAGIVRELIGLDGVTRALDLYAGVGLFTVTALARAKGVLAVEIDPGSSDDLRQNTSALANVHIRTEPVVDVLWDLRPGRDVFDLAVINPPRAGMGEAVVRALMPFAIPRLIMVSCDPGSLARDVAALARTGYALREAIPVDQFPGTPHVETVAVLERGG